MESFKGKFAIEVRTFLPSKTTPQVVDVVGQNTDGNDLNQLRWRLVRIVSKTLRRNHRYKQPNQEGNRSRISKGHVEGPGHYKAFKCS